jgi:hypothetical protein
MKELSWLVTASRHNIITTIASEATMSSIFQNHASNGWRDHGRAECLPVDCRRVETRTDCAIYCILIGDGTRSTQFRLVCV